MEYVFKKFGIEATVKFLTWFILSLVIAFIIFVVFSTLNNNEEIKEVNENVEEVISLIEDQYID